MVSNPYSQYKKMQVTTTDPVKLVVMLYEGAIVALRRAIGHIEKKDYEKKCKELIRAHDIIFELLSSLDREKGGDISANLESLYTYMIRRIMEANASLETGTIEEVIDHLETINDGWRELAKQRGVNLKDSSAMDVSKPAFEKTT